MKALTLIACIAVTGCSFGMSPEQDMCEHLVRQEFRDPVSVEFGSAVIHDNGDRLTFVWDRDELRAPNAFGTMQGAFGVCEILKGPGDVVRLKVS